MSRTEDLTSAWLGHIAKAQYNKKTHRWRLFVDNKPVQPSKLNHKFVRM